MTTAEIGKAFEVAPNDQLTFSAEDLESLSPADDDTIRIEHLLPSPMLDYSLLSRPTLSGTGPCCGGAILRTRGRRPEPAGHLGNWPNSPFRTMAYDRRASRFITSLAMRAALAGTPTGLSRCRRRRYGRLFPNELRALEKTLVPLG